jgi:hypothetical protein
MSQRTSGYARIERDAYQTPEWVTEALIPHLPSVDRLKVWEPAMGDGKMVAVLRKHCREVIGTDIMNGTDFLFASHRNSDAIITNPPYHLAEQFITHALQLTETGGLVAMLLRTDFDHAQARQHLFSRCRSFAKKVVLTKRIVWFDTPGAAPSFNHCWFIWDWSHGGPPVLCYGP